MGMFGKYIGVFKKFDSDGLSASFLANSVRSEFGMVTIKEQVDVHGRDYKGATVIAEVKSSDVPEDGDELEELLDAEIGVVSESKRRAREVVRKRRKENY